MNASLPSALALLLLATPAGAVIIKTGHHNTSAPAQDDPGWANVGNIGVVNGVYAGYGWVITAAHVGIGIGTIDLEGVLYPIVTSTRVVIAHDASTDADLAVFKLDPYPMQLPVLPIADVPPSWGTNVIMIGRGYDWDVEIPNVGFEWATFPVSRSKRWGTNEIGGFVEGVGNASRLLISTGSNRTSWALVTEFNQNPNPQQSPDECGLTTGDSGGGLFVESSPGSGNFELAGINVAILAASGQPPETTYYGNDMFSVDLSSYRQQLLDVIRACDDGVDNDGDTLADLNDPGCLWEGDDSEQPACSDGIDNDFDGDQDWPADPDCASAADLFEDTDLDGDFVADDEDDCLGLANPDQRDTNADGYGNLCDADYDDDGVVGAADYIMLIRAYGTSTGEPRYDEDIDADGDGLIGATEYILLVDSYGGPPGPSGLACAGTIPCP